MFVITNRIPVSEGHEDAFEDRFRHSMSGIEKSPGVCEKSDPTAGFETLRRQNWRISRIRGTRMLPRAELLGNRGGLLELDSQRLVSCCPQ